MNERDIRPVEALLRVSPTGKVKDIWPYPEPFYRQAGKKRQKEKSDEVKKMKNKAHQTPEHLGEKVDFEV